MEVSKWLKNERKKRGYTQEQLANEIGVTKESIGNWENSRHLPEQISIDKMIELFDLQNQCKYFANEIIEITGNINEQQNVDRNDNIIEQKKVPESSYDQVTCNKGVNASLIVVSVALIVFGVLYTLENNWKEGVIILASGATLFLSSHKFEGYISRDLSITRMVFILAIAYFSVLIQFICRIRGITKTEIIFSIIILFCMVAVFVIALSVICEAVHEMLRLHYVRCHTST